MKRIVELSQVISDLRALCDLNSQTKIARKFKVSPAYISDILKGRREPGESVLKPLGYKKKVFYKIIDEYEDLK